MDAYTIPASWINRRIDVRLLGCGGTGSEMIDELFRIHSLLLALGGEGLKVTAYDGDTVSEANIGRQRFWPCDIGLPKAEVLITRINSFGGVEWQYSNDRFDPETMLFPENHDQTFDLLITCVDRAKLRAKIGEKAACLADYDADVLWLDCGNDANSGNVILGHLSSEEQGTAIPNVYDLYPVLSELDDSAEPSCSTQEALARQDYGINRSVAREAANLLWQLLRHGKIQHHGSFVNISDGSVSPLRIDKKIWATFAQ